MSTTMITGVDPAAPQVVVPGTAGNDVLGQAGVAEQLVGGAGDDIYNFHDWMDVASEGAGQGYDIVYAGFDVSLRRFSQHVEELRLLGGADAKAVGNGLDNIIHGNDGANILNGAWGDDTLVGGAGDDRFLDDFGVESMIGGTGDDFYRVDDSRDQVVEHAGEGVDVVVAYRSFDLGTNGANVEELHLGGALAINGRGDDLANRIEGNAAGNRIDGAGGDDRLYGHGGDDGLIGGAGDDVLVGGAGADFLRGGAGDDLYIVADSGDAVRELAGEGVDTVVSDVDFALRNHSQHVENLRLSNDPEATATQATGNGLDNLIVGNDRGNVLNGAWGDDDLRGGAGDDLFLDDHGADRMAGGAGDDIYVIDHRGDQVVELAGEGVDTVKAAMSIDLREDVGIFVENLELSGGDVDGAGNGRDNVISGTDGANTLLGRWGDDTLQGGAGDDVLDGGVADDVLEGGAGADRFIFTGGHDRILDYTSGEDVVEADGFGSTGYQDAVGAATTVSIDGASAARLDFGGGNILDLLGITADELRNDLGVTPSSDVSVLMPVEDASLIGALGSGAEGAVIGEPTRFDLDGAVSPEACDTSLALTSADGLVRLTLLGAGLEVSGNDGPTGTVTELRIDLRDDPEAAFETALQAGRIQAPLETVIEQIEAARESGNAGEFYKVLDGYAIHGRTADLGGRLQGFEQDDVLSGGQGRDEIHGAGGDDALDGGVGADALFGGAGDDILVGGQGGDVLSGGAGADVFVFDGGHGPDVIVDFDLLEDRLDFTGLVESADDLHLQVRHGDTIIKGAEAPIVLEDVELHVQDIEDALIF